MSPRLVYLRPQPVAYVRVEVREQKAIATAWDRLRAWCAQTPFSETIQVAYGLTLPARQGAKTQFPTFEAAIKVPFADPREHTRGLSIKQIPGGAYVRKRHAGDAGDAATAMEDLRAKWTTDRGIELDLTRPDVAVYLGENCLKPELAHKVDLLLPVKMNEQYAVA